MVHISTSIGVGILKWVFPQHGVVVHMTVHLPDRHSLTLPSRYEAVSR